MALADEPGSVDVASVVAELHGRVRERLRSELRAGGGPAAFDDPALFAEVEGVLRAAASAPPTARLILPELLGEPDTWRLTTSIRYQSHRSRGIASVLIFVKQRLLMPLFRWLYEYSRDNFERQRRTNHVLFACLQELALETALLRRELRRVADGSGSTAPPDGTAAGLVARAPDPDPAARR